MTASLSNVREPRKGSSTDPYCVNAVNVCMQQNFTDKESLENLRVLGISMTQRMLTRIKANIRERKKFSGLEGFPSQDQIKNESAHIFGEVIERLLHVGFTAKDVATQLKAFTLLSTYLTLRLKLYRFGIYTNATG